MGIAPRVWVLGAWLALVSCKPNAARGMPPDPARLTAVQHEDVVRLERSTPGEVLAAVARLSTAVTGDADTLASVLVPLLDAPDPVVRQNTFFVLQARLDSGRDGRYLDRLIHDALEALEGRHTDFYQAAPMRVLLQAVQLRATDHKLRARVATWAQKHAAGCDNPLPAWTALISLGIVAPGTREAAVIALMGPPTSRGPDSLAWYCESRRHINPELVVTVVGGIVTAAYAHQR